MTATVRYDSKQRTSNGENEKGIFVSFEEIWIPCCRARRVLLGSAEKII